jgi:hypothetical protein
VKHWEEIVAERIPITKKWVVQSVVRGQGDARLIRDELIRSGSRAEMTGVFDPDGLVHQVVWIEKSD